MLVSVDDLYNGHSNYDDNVNHHNVVGVDVAPFRCYQNRGTQ